MKAKINHESAMANILNLPKSLKQRIIWIHRLKNNPANKKSKQYQKLQTNSHIEHLVLTDTNITLIHSSKLSVMLNYKSSYKTLTWSRLRRNNKSRCFSWKIRSWLRKFKDWKRIARMQKSWSLKQKSKRLK